MNIVNKLTLRHLRQNKRRTLVTLIGVIISVAMLTGVATIAVSFMDLLQRQEIADAGEWHVLYKDVDSEQLAVIKNDEATKTLVISKDQGYALLDGSQNRFKPYLFIKAYNAHGFEQFPIELSAGRLPKAANEVVISEAIATNGGVHFEIGDQLTLDVGERYTEKEVNRTLGQQDSLIIGDDGESVEQLIKESTESYTIVGTVKRPTWEPTWAPGYTIITYIDEAMIGEDETVHATVVLKKVQRSLYAHAERLAEENNIEAVQFNNGLLRYHGVTNNDNLETTLYSLTAIIMVVIVVGSVSLIYNAFAISVSERSRHLGMLSSVGATRKQKRNSVFFEGMVIGLISIPIGVLCGLGGIGITFMFINANIHGALGVNEKLMVAVTPLSIIIACAVSILTIFISTYIPARRASRISAIDAIRQATDVKLTGKAVRTSRLVRYLFGMEAEIGLKNLKRHKRRYQAVVFSLIISIVLFLSVSFIIDNLKKSLELSQTAINYDMQVHMNALDDETYDQLLGQIISFDDVTEYNEIELMRGTQAWIDETLIPQQLKDRMYAGNIVEGKYPYRINIHALTDESFQAYARDIGADVERLTSMEQLAAIVINKVTYEDYELNKIIEAKAINVQEGHWLDIVGRNYFETDDNWVEADVPVGKIEIATLTEQFPMGIKAEGIGELELIVSENVMEQLKANADFIGTSRYLYLNSEDPLKTQQEIERLSEMGNLYVYNVFKNRQQEQQMIMLMSVFTYGFIALITAICMANIFNTISTSISLRKREFAMLKSVGMTPKSFNKMLNYESIFYGMKSLLYGLPISLVVMYLIHRSMMNSFGYSFMLPWSSIIFVIVAVFAIVGSAMLYSGSKVKKENIIDALKQESI